MNFFPHTSVVVPRQATGLVAADRQSLTEFWNRVDGELEDGLSGAIGCYIFSVRAGNGSLPWYVGMAEMQSFRRECFQPHKLVHYNNILAARGAGTPLLTLIAKYTPTGRLVGPTGNEHNDIQFLETLLIGKCIARNFDLYNKRDTRFLREMIVPGLLNSPQGRLPDSALDFRALVGD